MRKNTAFIGLDVHATSIFIAVAEPGRQGEIRALGSIPNRREAIRKKFRKLLKQYKRLHVCYEAGPCGYVLYWQLTEMDIKCEVIAPSLIPKKPGDRVKTDRRDALTLARCLRAGDLTAVWVPNPQHEALRNLVRARESIKKDQRSAKHRLSKLLLTLGLHRPEGTTNWTQKHFRWLEKKTFEDSNLNYVFQEYLGEVKHHKERLVQIERQIDLAIEQSPAEIREVAAALQLLRGVAKITAFGMVAEIGKFSRFSKPDKLMAYAGIVPSEYTTGGPAKRKQGGITKTGNSHLRRLLTESAWNYRFKPSVNDRMKKCADNVSPEFLPMAREKAWKAQHRLCSKYRNLLAKGKTKQLTVCAVGRELLGFMWDIAVSIEMKQAGLPA